MIEREIKYSKSNTVAILWRSPLIIQKPRSAQKSLGKAGKEMAPGHQSKLFKLKKQSLKGRNKCEMKETRLPSCESLRTIRNYRHDRCPYSKRKYLSIACENLVDLWPNLVPSKLSNYKKLHDIFLQKSNCFSIMLRIPTNF